MEFSLKTIESLRDAHASCRQEVASLRAKLDEVSKNERLLRDFLDYSTKAWALHFLALVDKETPWLKSMRDMGNPIIPGLEEAYRVAKEEADRVMRLYPGLLEEGCKAAGLPIDQDSRHPRYTFNDRFLVLEVDERRRLARLSDHEGRLGELSADIPAVIEAIQREQQRLFGRPFDGKKFIRLLRSKYKVAFQREKLKDGDSVPVRKITQRFGKDVKGFRTDEFLVDLSRLVERGPIEVDGRVLDLQQTKDTNDGVLLPRAAGRGYIGFIVFREA